MKMKRKKNMIKKIQKAIKRKIEQLVKIWRIKENLITWNIIIKIKIKTIMN